MRTVYPNPKAVGMIILVFLVVLFFLISIHQINQHFSSRKQPKEGILLARDINARKEAEDQQQLVQIPLEANDNHRQLANALNPLKGTAKKDGGEIVDIPEAVAVTPVNEPQNVDAAAAKDNKQEKKTKEEDEEKQVIVTPVPRVANNSEDETRKEKIVEMVTHAWNNYKKFAWGANELKPILKKSHSQPIFGGAQMMATIVDGADTLWLVGLKESYKEARDYIRDNFDISKATGTLSVFEVTIRHIGGFLSLYALTKEKFYIEKAKTLADSLLLAFDTPIGIPKSLVNPSSRTASNYGWAMGGSSILAEIGSLHLEFTYLSELTGDPLYANKVQKIRDVLDSATKKDGLYSNYISPESGTFQGDHVSLGAMGDSFYEILIKSWIRSRTDKQAYKMYKEAAEAVRNHLLFVSKGGLTYLAELKNGVAEHKMGHLACFAPGMFALEAEYETNSTKKEEIMKIAEGLGETCHESYVRSKTGIGPEMFFFREGREAMTGDNEAGYILRPEAIEGWFYLWRLTKNKKYKDWVWDAVTAIDKHCHVENGFAGLRSVYEPEQGYDDVQQSFFIAETLKYAFLTFADDQLPLDKWVFNTEAHLFPVEMNSTLNNTTR